jgi:hypothetical protein
MREEDIQGLVKLVAYTVLAVATTNCIHCIVQVSSSKFDEALSPRVASLPLGRVKYSKFV